jgi:signal transduction histidine kinase
MMDEPRILKFPTANSAPAEAPAGELDLRAILAAWNEATGRLERTHAALRGEVRRLSDELDAKNRELARQNRLADLGQMASHVAHEVRNSLVPIKLYLSLLRRRISDDRGSVDVLDKVASGFTALEATVGDLLHFSSDRQPDRSQFPLADLLDEVCQSLAPQLTAQGIWAEIDCPEESSVEADRDMVRRALLNLVLNALDAMPDGGELVVTAIRLPGAWAIEVADSGPGIPEKHRDRLCEPFFTTKGSGTGLGLAIVERIVEAHGGTLAIANCPTGGAAFTLSIPQFSRLLEKAA